MQQKSGGQPLNCSYPPDQRGLQGVFPNSADCGLNHHSSAKSENPNMQAKVGKNTENMKAMRCCHVNVRYLIWVTTRSHNHFSPSSINLWSVSDSQQSSCVLRFMSLLSYLCSLRKSPSCLYHTFLHMSVTFPFYKNTTPTLFLCNVMFKAMSLFSRKGLISCSPCFLLSVTLTFSKHSTLIGGLMSLLTYFSYRCQYCPLLVTLAKSARSLPLPSVAQIQLHLT